MSEGAYVYIMASRRNGTLYIGATTALAKRAWEHRNGVVQGFTRQYGCTLLVWYEAHESMFAARAREKQMKGWKRAWKISVIEAVNPLWQDLADTLV